MGPTPRPKRPVVGFGRLTMGQARKIGEAKTISAAESMAKAEEQQAVSDKELDEEIEASVEFATSGEMERNPVKNPIIEARKREEFQKHLHAMVEQAEREDAEQISALRERISPNQATGKKRVEIGGEDAAKIREQAGTLEAMRAQARGVVKYGGELEKPMEFTSDRKSGVEFSGFGATQEATPDSSPDMFSLADLERQEEEKKRKGPAAA